MEVEEEGECSNEEVKGPEEVGKEDRRIRR